MRKKTNKALAILLTVMFILTLLPAMALPAFAAEDDDDDGYEGIVVKVGVPGEELTYEMVVIALAEAGIDRYIHEELFSLIINEGVTGIANDAFKECAGITSVTIPVSVVEIHDSVFCSFFPNLTSIDVAEDNKFYWSIDGVLFNRDMTRLIRFPQAKMINEYIIPEEVIEILPFAFSNCGNLEYVTILDGVESIGYSAFGWSGLTGITLPDSVSSIEAAAFEACGMLAYVDLPNGLTVINDITFVACVSLTDIAIPDSVTSIGYGAFTGSGLTNIIIPDSVTSIGGSAFSNCDGLSSVLIPKSVTFIGSAAFGFNGNLKEINVHPDNAEYASVNGILFTKDLYVLHSVPGGLSGQFVVLSGVTSIAEYAFFGCYHLTEVTITEGVSAVGDYAFIACLSLTNVIFSEDVTTIGYMVFSASANLQSLTFMSLTPPAFDTRGIDPESMYYGFPVVTIYVPASGLSAYTALLGTAFPAHFVVVPIGDSTHKHEYQTSVTDPTCTEQGYTTYTCANCDDSYRGDFTAALGHDFSILIDHKNPTADEEGYDVWGCSRCDETKTVIIPAAWAVTVNGVLIFIKYVDGVARLDLRELEQAQVNTIFNSPGNEIVFDLRAHPLVDIYVEAGWFRDIDKMIVIKTAKGDIAVKTKTLWNNSGKTRAIQIRDGSASIGNI